MTNREYFGEESVEHLHSRLEKFLDSEKGGFVFIMTDEPHKITDCYRDVCAAHVFKDVEKAVNDAAQLGLLAESSSPLK